MSEKVLEIIKRFEEAAKIHGANQLNVARGNIQEKHAYESAKTLKALREELYKEISK